MKITTTRKLSLSRTTLRHLSVNALRSVAGGNGETEYCEKKETLDYTCDSPSIDLPPDKVRGYYPSKYPEGC